MSDDNIPVSGAIVGQGGGTRVIQSGIVMQAMEEMSSLPIWRLAKVWGGFSAHLLLLPALLRARNLGPFEPIRSIMTMKDAVQVMIDDAAHIFPNRVSPISRKIVKEAVRGIFGKPYSADPLVASFRNSAGDTPIGDVLTSVIFPTHHTSAGEARWWEQVPGEKNEDSDKPAWLIARMATNAQTYFTAEDFPDGTHQDGGQNTGGNVIFRTLHFLKRIMEKEGNINALPGVGILGTGMTLYKYDAEKLNSFNSKFGMIKHDGGSYLMSYISELPFDDAAKLLRLMMPETSFYINDWIDREVRKDAPSSDLDDATPLNIRRTIDNGWRMVDEYRDDLECKTRMLVEGVKADDLHKESRIAGQKIYTMLKRQRTLKDLGQLNEKLRRYSGNINDHIEKGDEALAVLCRMLKPMHRRELFDQSDALLFRKLGENSILNSFRKIGDGFVQAFDRIADKAGQKIGGIFSDPEPQPEPPLISDGEIKTDLIYPHDDASRLGNNSISDAFSGKADHARPAAAAQIPANDPQAITPPPERRARKRGK